MNMFRVLRADEIDCRISQVKKDGSGLSLLLYKDARCDQNILDETVTPMHWKREHTRENRNCIVSIWSDELKQWISKEDTGTESNTEREKGLASDSFKRACFNWGIGRELYTAPFIWIKRGDFTFKEGKCYDRFTVKGIGYTNGVITGLEIVNQALNRIVYSWGTITEEAREKPEQPDDEPETDQKPEEEQKPFAEQAESVTIRSAAAVPPVPEPKKETKPAVTPSPVIAYLTSSLKELRESRGIPAAKNNKLFADQRKTLVAAGLAPDKPLEDYTMEEAIAMIDAMYKRFSPEGTEILK